MVVFTLWQLARRCKIALQTNLLLHLLPWMRTETKTNNNNNNQQQDKIVGILLCELEQKHFACTHNYNYRSFYMQLYAIRMELNLHSAVNIDDDTVTRYSSMFIQCICIYWEWQMAVEWFYAASLFFGTPMLIGKIKLSMKLGFCSSNCRSNNSISQSYNRERWEHERKWNFHSKNPCRKSQKKVRCSGEKVALALRATINMASSIRLSKWQSILSHMQSIDVLTR